MALEKSHFTLLGTGGMLHRAWVELLAAENIAQRSISQQEMELTRPELIAWILIHIGLGYGVLDALGVPHQGMDRKGVSVRDVLERNMIRAG